MNANDHTTSFTVDQSPAEVFDAINNVRSWWSEKIDGDTDLFGAEFRFHHKDQHCSTKKISEFVPGKRVVWRVVDGQINFVKDKTEWTARTSSSRSSGRAIKLSCASRTVGLVPTIECYGGSSGAWGFYVGQSLRKLTTTGNGDPARKE
jgi:hypothetical protein